jgi:hypothetical protein
MDSRDAAVDGNRGFMLSDIQREFKLSTDGYNAADDVSSIDAAAVPSIRSAMRCLNKHLIGATVVSCDCDGLVEVPKEPFYADCFVVSSSGLVKPEAKDFTHFFEHAEKNAGSVDDDKSAKTNFQQYFLHEDTG